ncbi:MAG: RNA-directed DNA polymerase, partial [Bacteroidota bacterium]
SNILSNHGFDKGMPLGNLTSQFFANVYLNELDQFVKHNLKAKYYIRYVDDFVILHTDKATLEGYLREISAFLTSSLSLELNNDKCKFQPLDRGVDFLGFRVFYHHRLLRKRNVRSAYRKIHGLKTVYSEKDASYDTAYNFLQGWLAYARNADTYKVRMRMSENFIYLFPNEISSIEINRLLKYSKM